MSNSKFFAICLALVFSIPQASPPHTLTPHPLHPVGLATARRPVNTDQTCSSTLGLLAARLCFEPPAPTRTAIKIVAAIAPTTSIGFGLAIPDSALDAFEPTFVVALQGVQLVLPWSSKIVVGELAKALGGGRLGTLVRGKGHFVFLQKVGGGVAMKIGLGQGLVVVSHFRWRRDLWKLALCAIAALLLLPFTLAPALAYLQLDLTTLDLTDTDTLEALLIHAISVVQTILASLRCKISAVVVGEIGRLLGKGRLRLLLGGVGWGAALRKGGASLCQRLGMTFAFSSAPSILQWIQMEGRPAIEVHLCRIGMTPLITGCLTSSYLVYIATASGVPNLVLILDISNTAVPRPSPSSSPPPPSPTPPPYAPPLPG
ncbi:hypothetical protein C8R44DRAFT_847819 [Mycena epipterygia]|nr:hypothetical protein C8R44DRAFT_847819 [Mycena epipterygia]